MSFNILDNSRLKMASREPPPPDYSASSLTFLDVFNHLLPSPWAFSVEGWWLGFLCSLDSTSRQPHQCPGLQLKSLGTCLSHSDHTPDHSSGFPASGTCPAMPLRYFKLTRWRSGFLLLPFSHLYCCFFRLTQSLIYNCLLTGFWLLLVFPLEVLSPGSTDSQGVLWIEFGWPMNLGGGNYIFISLTSNWSQAFPSITKWRHGVTHHLWLSLKGITGIFYIK